MCGQNFVFPNFVLNFLSFFWLPKLGYIYFFFWRGRGAQVYFVTESAQWADSVKINVLDLN